MIRFIRDIFDALELVLDIILVRSRPSELIPHRTNLLVLTQTSRVELGIAVQSSLYRP